MSLAADVAVVARRLRSSRGYTLGIVITLALALGANTAIFGVLHSTVLNPLAARDPGRLVVVWESDLPKNVAVVELAYNTFRDWATHSRSFSHAGAFGSSTWTEVLRGVDESVRLASTAVSATFFDTLDARPLLGRTFRAEDDLPNAERVMILSHRLWKTRFGGNPSIVGTTLQFDHPYVVVGVMPAGFDFPRGTDFWIPVIPILAASEAKWKINARSDVGVLFMVARLRDGVNPEAASDELNALAAHLQRSGGRRFGTAVAVTPVVDMLLGPLRPALWGLFTAGVILLVIACANVAGLMMKRASLRRREFAIRLGLGATAGHLSRLWLIETVMLACAGGCLGLLAAYWITRTIMTLAPQAVPGLTAPSFNVPVAVFTLVAVVASAFVCGAWPIVDLRSLNLNAALKDAPRGTRILGWPRTRSTLVTLQISLAVVLLIAGGLAIRSAINVGRVELGFTPSGVVTLQVSARPGTETTNEWVGEVIRRVAAVPGVETVGGVGQLPSELGPIGSDVWVTLEGQVDTPESRRQNPSVNYQTAFPGYFQAMRIALTQGRLFNAQDDARAPRVALVSETTARRLWPGLNPLQRRILLPNQTPGGPPAAWRTVVGVVSDVRYRGIADVRLDVYDAPLQSGFLANSLAVRGPGDLVSLAAAVRAEVRRLDPQAVIDRIVPMEEIVARVTAPWRFTVWVFAALAIVACALASVGLFGLVALDVVQRHREFALRLAVGAQPTELLRLALFSGGRSALLGIMGGLLISLLGTRAVQGMLFQVSALDVATYAGVVAFIVTIVGLASYLPARRAAAVDPLELLKAE
ncbi:MAG: ABC transporter permease [Burkholderiales bacterium]